MMKKRKRNARKPLRDCKLRILRPSDDLVRAPKIPVRVVPGIPEQFSTMLYYDHTGVIFCSACNMYVTNKKAGLRHARLYHEKNNIYQPQKPEGEKTP